ncbi:MAG: hypothetical protein GTO16_01115 [Candidatus Aminicenantes bacterium]|nr:hypothetical protein [Candidatus Aminicenantes bacterium]
MKRTKNSLKITAILCVFLFLLSCDYDLTRSEKSGVVLTVVRIYGDDGTGGDADYLISDVDVGGTAFTDPIMVTLEAKFKKPVPLATTESYKTSVMIDRYTVTYMTSYNGGGTGGVDVPFAFEGSLSAVCEVEGTVDLDILAVRAEAKTVAPLAGLAAPTVLPIVARFDFIGHDLGGNPVQATGYMTIYFSDWANP